MTTPPRPVKRTFRHDSNQVSNPHQGPILCATIQTSLLNVGMRIRKSVPEGYKTKPKVLSTSNSYSPLRVDGSLHRNYSPAGLLPYCGIFKTGNLEQEPTPLQDDVPPLDCSNDDDALPSSQESILSDIPLGLGDRFASLPLLVNDNKRPYDEQEEPSPTHPDPLHSHPSGNANATHFMALRPMLQPKTRKVRPVREESLKDQGEEGMDVDEFEEVEFLRFEDAMREVEF